MKESIYRPDGALNRADFVDAPLVRGHRLTRYILRVLHGTGGVIAGGYARWAASSRKNPLPSDDVDVFCRDEAAFTRVRCALESFGHRLSKENLVSVVYHERRPWIGVACPPVNVVKPVVDGRVQTAGDLHEVLHNFDFTVSKAGIVDASRALVHHAFAEDEAKLRLRFTRIHTPVTGFLRTIKYTRKGYKISLRELMRIFHYWDSQQRDYRKSLKAIIHKPSGFRVRAEKGVPEDKRVLRVSDEPDDRYLYDPDFGDAPDVRDSLPAATLGAYEYEDVDIDEDALDLADVYRLMLIGPGARKGRRR